MIKVTMKKIIQSSIIFCFIMAKQSFASSVSIPISKPLTPENKTSVLGLLDSVKTYPALEVNETSNTMVQVPVTRLSRYMLPKTTVGMMQKSNISILRPTSKDLYTNYPAGATLFAKNSDIAQQFDMVITAIKANNELIKFFRKIHFNCLNQLYNYLMCIHTNLIARNVGGSYDATGKLKIDLESFLDDDINCATNQKSLIVSFLINIIESQFHEMARSCAPTLPYLFATPAAKILIQNDFAVDLTSFAQPSTDEVVQHLQTTYFDFLKNYITFFKLYTDLLFKPDTKTGYTEFTTIIENMLSQKLTINMNPQMFFYNDESLYAIKIIPNIAIKLSTESTPLNWAESVVTAAEKSIMSKQHPVAYFTDSENKKTENTSQASHLFLLSMSGDNIFEQELLEEPKWLGSSHGIINMLKACLGDFSHVASLNIVDPFTQAILEKSTTGTIDQKTLTEMQRFTSVVTQSKNNQTSKTQDSVNSTSQEKNSQPTEKESK